jgi:hypothetical protein
MSSAREEMSLAVDAAQVELNRLVAEEERSTDLLVRLSFGHLFRGLPDDRAQLPRWGYVVNGKGRLSVLRSGRDVRGR